MLRNLLYLKIFAIYFLEQSQSEQLENCCVQIVQRHKNTRPTLKEQNGHGCFSLFHQLNEDKALGAGNPVNDAVTLHGCVFSD